MVVFFEHRNRSPFRGSKARDRTHCDGFLAMHFSETKTGRKRKCQVISMTFGASLVTFRYIKSADGSELMFHDQKSASYIAARNGGDLHHRGSFPLHHDAMAGRRSTGGAGRGYGQDLPAGSGGRDRVQGTAAPAAPAYPVVTHPSLQRLVAGLVLGDPALRKRTVAEYLSRIVRGVA